ncbi:hypothetical protein NLG97_g4250 [Lecanicillium saksenae]|uniref:Uncharacterized protein n=1 Tax=Lecanicillium saksenae TaxID=468837 RepID=A0ACC1QVV4_9HYPO|nr:hypothetical protein NLG97_g4250 [Lecanicillium saksenae]
MVFPLESLPNEILIEILNSIPDLATLCNVVYTSPAARRLFEANQPVRIVEAVLTSGYTCEDIQSLVAFTAQYYAGNPPNWYTEDMADWFCHEGVIPTLLGGEDSANKPLLSSNTPLSALYCLLQRARDIANESRRYLAEALALFRSLKPRRPVGDDFTLAAGRFHGLELLLQIVEDIDRRISQDIQTEVVVTSDIGPPTWIEEQRAMRAFWRLQLAYELSCDVRKLAIFTRNSYRPNDHEARLWLDRFGSVIQRPLSSSHAALAQAAGCYNHEKETYYSPRYLCDEYDQYLPTLEYHEIACVVEYIQRRFGKDVADMVASGDGQIPIDLGWVEKAQDTRKAEDSDNLVLIHAAQTRSASGQQRWAMPTAADRLRIQRLSASAARTSRQFVD